MNRKNIFVSFSFACLIAIITCIIVDYAMNKQITWSWYPIISVPFGWLVFSPLHIKKYGTPLSILSLTIFSLPFLFLLEKITPVSGWFTPLAIPSAAVGAAAIWVIYLVFRFLKIRLWYKSAITVFLAGVIVNPVISYFVDMYVYSEPRIFSTLISSVPCLILAVTMIIQGRVKDKTDS